MSQQEQLQSYFDALTNEYDALQRAIEANMSRNNETALEFEREVATAQRETIDLSKQIAAEWADPAAVYSVLTSAAVSAQTRALNFARLAYEQASQAGAEGSKQVDELSKAQQQLNDAAAQLTSEWARSMPFAETWQRTAESFTPAAAEKKTSTSKKG